MKMFINIYLQYLASQTFEEWEVNTTSKGIEEEIAEVELFNKENIKSSKRNIQD